MRNQEVGFVHAGEPVFLCLLNGDQIGATHKVMVTRQEGTQPSAGQQATLHDHEHHYRLIAHHQAHAR